MHISSRSSSPVRSHLLCIQKRTQLWFTKANQSNTLKNQESQNQNSHINAYNQPSTFCPHAPVINTPTHVWPVASKVKLETAKRTVSHCWHHRLNRSTICHPPLFIHLNTPRDHSILVLSHTPPYLILIPPTTHTPFWSNTHQCPITIAPTVLQNPTCKQDQAKKLNKQSSNPQKQHSQNLAQTRKCTNT